MRDIIDVIDDLMGEVVRVNYYDIYDEDNFKIIECIGESIVSNYIGGEIAVVCIGTDRNTGDSLGPNVGNYLVNEGLNNVYGSLNKLVHSENLFTYKEEIDREKYGFVIAVDSGLCSNEERLYNILIKNESMSPGSGLNKDLPEIGDMSIIGLVAKDSYLLKVLKDLTNVKLSIIYKMVEIIGEGVMLGIQRIKNKQIKKEVAVGEK